MTPRELSRLSKVSRQCKLALKSVHASIDVDIFAFSVVNKAWKTLESEDTRAKCMDVIEEAKARTDHMVSTVNALGLQTETKRNYENS